MKKHVIILMQVMLLLSAKMIGQAVISNIPRELTPNHIFDTLRSRTGEKFNLADLNKRSAKPFGGNSISTVPTESCDAGFFVLFFAPNSIFTAGTQSTQAQAIACEVFRNYSGLISSPLSYAPGVGPKVNIYCDNTNTLTSPGLLGQASAVYAFPNLPNSTTPGIVDGLVYKMLTSGTDPYNNMPITNFYNSYAQNNSFLSRLYKCQPHG